GSRSHAAPRFLSREAPTARRRNRRAERADRAEPLQHPPPPPAARDLRREAADAAGRDERGNVMRLPGTRTGRAALDLRIATFPLRVLADSPEESSRDQLKRTFH